MRVFTYKSKIQKQHSQEFKDSQQNSRPPQETSKEDFGQTQFTRWMLDSTKKYYPWNHHFSSFLMVCNLINKVGSQKQHSQEFEHWYIVVQATRAN